MNEQIALFSKINEKKINDLGLSVFPPSFSYGSAQEKLIETVECEEAQPFYVLNDVAPEWSPIEHYLTITQTITLKHPYVLFGDEGVTSSKNKLGIAVYFHSKSSNFQRTENVGTIFDTESPLRFSFEHTFNANMLRGIVHFQYFIYLKETNQNLPFTASTIGTNLSEGYIGNYSIIIDGKGSEFPVEEIADKTQPLWRLAMSWTDVFEDYFDSSSVKLIFNREHEIFKSLMGNNKNKVNRYLMNEIVIMAMSMIVQKAIIIDKAEINQETEFKPGSIAQVLWYWITTYELNLESLESISHSFHKKADTFIGGEDK